MILNKKLIEFLIPDYNLLQNFSHKTRYEDVAKQILQEGFVFCDSFQKTTDAVTNDAVYLQYWHNLRERYGNYTIVISISKQITDLYIDALNRINNNQVAIEQVITEKPPYINENDEEMYTLPKEFIKGYFNSLTEDIVHNIHFNPFYDCEAFAENINRLQEKGTLLR